MDFYKAGFPARYGGRLSSVVDVQTKEGNMKEFHGSASVGLIAGNLSLEGPIIKDRTSFSIALRRTWLDVITAPTLAIFNAVKKDKSSDINFRYAFHDLNARIDHRVSDRSRLFVSIYNGNDVLKATSEDNPSRDGSISYYLDKTQVSMRWGISSLPQVGHMRSITAYSVRLPVFTPVIMQKYLTEKKKSRGIIITKPIP